MKVCRGQLRIRQVDPMDPRIHAILDRLDRELFPSDTLDKKKGCWWLMYARRYIPIAFAGMRASTSWAKTGYLCRVGVLPAYQGQGLQRRLLRVRETKARWLGWKWLLVDTRPDNYASINNLIRCKYRLYAPRCLWSFKRDLYWRKQL